MCLEFVFLSKPSYPKIIKGHSPVSAYSVFIVLLLRFYFHSNWNLPWVIRPTLGSILPFSPDTASGKVSRDFCVAKTERQFRGLVWYDFSAAFAGVGHTFSCKHIPLLASGRASFLSFPSISLAFLCLLFWLIFFSPISWYFSWLSSELSSLCPTRESKLYTISIVIP